MSEPSTVPTLSPLPSPVPVAAPAPVLPVAAPVPRALRPLPEQHRTANPLEARRDVTPTEAPSGPSTAAAPSPSQGPALPQQASVSPPKRDRNRYRVTEDIYIVRFAGEVTLLHTRGYGNDQMSVGHYHTIPAGDTWAQNALSEAARMSRIGAAIRIHTTERDVTDLLRDVRRVDSKNPQAQDLRTELRRQDKELIPARPDREPLIWREFISMIGSGKTPHISPLVTYLVNTSALTDFEHVYCGVVMIGRGQILVHTAKTKGDDLVEAELDMMSWVLEAVGGGGRVDVHHSQDGARRIWEQADVLAQEKGDDALGHSGSRLRTLVREAGRLRTHIQPARRPVPEYDRFARLAVASAYAGDHLL